MPTTQAMAAASTCDPFDEYFTRAAQHNASQHTSLYIDHNMIDIRRPSLPVSVVQDHDRSSRKAGGRLPRQRSSSEGNNDGEMDKENQLSETVKQQQHLSTDTQSQQQRLAYPLMEKTSSGEDGLERAHSAPQSRSSSWRKATRPTRAAANKRQSTVGGAVPVSTSAQGAGPRRESVPLERVVSERLAHLRLMYEEEDMCVVRHFASCKGKAGGVICRGDSFKKRSGGELDSAAGEERRASLGSALNGSAAVAEAAAGVAAKGADSAPFKVLVLGDQGVGKTALIQQFMTSEYLGAVETGTDEYNNEKTLSVLLDGKETMINVSEISVNKNIHDCEEADAYVIVFSMADRESYDFAVSLLDDVDLERGVTGKQPAVILVGNKADIVRSRQVTADEVHEVCCRYRCKMIDLSASLNHRVDELLVGIVQQVHLHHEQQHSVATQKTQEAGSQEVKATTGSRKNSLLKSAAKGLVQRLLRRQSLRTWSPDNLQTL